ncbi:MAG: hypothetical protein K9G49_03685 [Taibaiella sp.]|nr:hypothetical protein [Taibaiella sp.]
MKSTPKEIDKDKQEKTIPIAEVHSLISALGNTIQSIQRLNNTLSAIAHIRKTTSNQTNRYFPTDTVTIPVDSIQTFLFEDESKKEENRNVRKRSQYDKYYKSDEISSNIERIKSIAELTESAERIANLLSDMHPTIKDHIKPLTTISKVAKVTASETRILNTIVNGAGLVEGAMAADELITGIVALTEVLSGPPGWALFLGTLAASGVAAYLDKEQHEKEANQANTENNKNTKRALRTFGMSSTESDDYILQRRKRLDNINIVPDQDERDWKMTYNPAAEFTKRYGKHAYDLSIPFPVGVADNTYHPQNVLPNTIAAQPIAPETGKSYISQTNALHTRTMSAGLTNGMKGFESAATKEILQVKAYDLKHQTNTAEMKNLAILEVSTLLPKSSNEGKKNPAHIYFAPGNRTESRQKIGPKAK